VQRHFTLAHALEHYDAVACGSRCDFCRREDAVGQIVSNFELEHRQ
jgi:hypothetical protein